MVHNAYSSYKTVYLSNISSTYPKSADLKITQNGTLNCPINYLVETFLGDFIGFQNYKNTLTDKKSGTNFWSTLSWTNNYPKKGHKLSLQVHDPPIPKQYIVVMWSTKNKSWQNNVGPTLNQLTPKLHPKEPTPMRYLAEILPDATARTGSHKNSITWLKSGTSLGSALILAMFYLKIVWKSTFLYMDQVLSRYWLRLCKAQKRRSEKKNSQACTK